MPEVAAKQLRHMLETIDVRWLETLRQGAALDGATLQRVAMLETARGSVQRVLTRADTAGNAA